MHIAELEEYILSTAISNLLIPLSASIMIALNSNLDVHVLDDDIQLNRITAIIYSL